MKFSIFIVCEERNLGNFCFNTYSTTYMGLSNIEMPASSWLCDYPFLCESFRRRKMPRHVKKCEATVGLFWYFCGLPCEADGTGPVN